MAYGIIKVDSITFTNGGIDQTVTVSGIVQSISGNITATGTIQGATIIGTSTVSGTTVTGDSGQYGNLTAISGVYTTQLSGATITGDAGSFTTVTGGVATITSGVFALGTNSLPSISFSSDPDTGIYSPGADQLALSTSGTQRVQFGTGEVVFNDDGNNYDFRIEGDTVSNLFFVDASADAVLVGTSSAIAASPLLQVEQTTGAEIALGRQDTSVVADDLMGGVGFWGRDTSGVVYTEQASVKCFADGTHDPGTNPTRLVFSTCPAGSATPVARMTIDNAGSLIYGTSTSPGADITSGTGFYYQISTGLFYVRSNGGPVATFNRGSNDGTLVEFKQDQTTEGTISVSGTTVSYNGAHLSRWSQLPSGAERTDILRGTVLSNIDEMCEWGEEENEQLNRMKVSDIEGDKNVSGVFQAWDDDDDTYINDFYCAMTGDFIIRIGAGVIVERGDLLISAGDGTAKPQDDNIIRSKTIAKVTSTNVSCTYDDGSYCVPCVLMAC